MLGVECIVHFGCLFQDTRGRAGYKTGANARRTARPAMTAIRAKLLHNRFAIAARHYRNVISHITAKKLVNLAHNEVELRSKKLTLSSLPYFIKIEVSGSCQLRCPGCVLGAAETGRYNPDAMLSLEGLKIIIDQLSDVLMGVNMCLLGEPMLNPDLPALISYCNEKNVGSVFPTNLSVKLSRSDIEDLVSSGLDHMIVSIDGTTQEAYEKYRRGGNLELVLENSSALIAKKKGLRSRRPFMEFKFILFDHNRGQLDEARELSEAMGFDRFSVVWDNASPETAATLKRARSRNLAKRRACFWPWSSVVFRWDGTVWPCCSNRSVMGNIFEQDFAVIWNSESYRRLRRFHRTHEPADVARMCAHCMHF